MRIILTLMLVLLARHIASAQKLIEEQTSITSNEQLKLDLDFADNIILKTWDKNEVKVKATVNINDNSDNDAYSLNVTKNSIGVTFTEKIKDLDKLQKSYTIDEDGKKTKHCNIELDIVYEVYLPSKAMLKVETISGNIEGKGLLGELDLNSISGDIDISLPKTIQADLDFSTISGEMFSDFEFESSKSSAYKHHFVKMDFNYELNGGGKDIELTTISGNIYFRKL